MSAPKSRVELLTRLFEQLPEDKIREIVGGIAEDARTGLPTGAPPLATLAAEAAEIVLRHGALGLVVPALDRLCLRCRESLGALACEAGIVLSPPRVVLLYSHESSATVADAIALAARLRGDGFDARLERPDAGSRGDDRLDRELGMADAVVVLCTAPLRHAVEEVADDRLGPAVALLRERDDAGLERWVPAVIEANATVAAIPNRLAGRDRYLLPRQYEALLDGILALRARSPATTADAGPPLRRLARPFAVVGDPVDPRTAALAKRLGVAVDAGEQAARALDATVVVVASARLPASLGRLSTATDRDILHADGAGDDHVRERAVQLYRARMRAWWRRAGSELMAGALAAAAAPSLAAFAWGTAEHRPLLWTATWLLGAGFILCSGLLADAATTAGRAPAERAEIRRWFFVVAEYAVFGADARSRARRLGALLLAFIALWAAFFGVMNPLTPEQRAPLLFTGGGALALGGLSLVLVGCSRKGPWRASITAAALITLVGAHVLTNLGLRWAERDEPWFELLPMLFALPSGYVPATWLLAGPGLAPLCVVAAALVAVACARAVPWLWNHRIGLRAAGVVLLAFALAWWIMAR